MATRPGSLRIYLGAAPGVGKTVAMLDEAQRRANRGADVVIGIVETHGRALTAERVGDLEQIPLRTLHHRSTTLHELDVDAVVERHPDVVLVDEFAHTNAPGSVHAKRWQDVEAILAAGIDVISTLNVQHLESLNDVVARITGVTQRETVPDAVVRRADQIELVDMSPEALRRRMAHGNVYPAERIDAALANYFRPGNLAALRELALLWLAGRVEESLSAYLADHGITDTWETRERVAVGITGAPGGERLIRRAARMAGRVGGDLMGVHVTVGDGLATDTGPELDGQRRLVRELGGSVHEIVGTTRATALVSFAEAEKATQLVLGASRRSRWYELRHGSFVADVSRLATGLDIHVIAAERDEPDEHPLASPRGGRAPIERRRVIGAWLLMLVAAPLLTVAMVALRDDAELSTVLLLFLTLVVVVSAIGGRLVALVAAVVSSLLVNWFLVEPHHTFDVQRGQNLVALAVFVAVAATVGTLVNVAERRRADARLARGEAEALARSAAQLVGDPHPLPALIDHLRTTFGLDGVTIRTSSGPVGGPPESGLIASSGDVSGDVSLRLPLRVGRDVDRVLELHGRSTSADDQRVLRVLADQLAIALETEQLERDAATARTLADIDAVRTSLLRAVSHDLRTPLASIKAMVSGLRDVDVDWTPDQLAEGLETIDTETDRLTRLVANLLDASRLQIGALAVDVRPVDISEVVVGALDSLALGPHDVAVDVAAELPLVAADPALLERSLANLVSNAVRHSPVPGSVTISATVASSPADVDTVLVRIVDRGPGIPERDHAKVLAPFQRLGDQPGSSGVGLGMSIAAGFVEAMGATLSLDTTPGGGLTVNVALPQAAPLPPGRERVEPESGPP